MPFVIALAILILLWICWPILAAIFMLFAGNATLVMMIAGAGLLFMFMVNSAGKKAGVKWSWERDEK